jgi:lipopolysaccharide transport system permease protein
MESDKWDLIIEPKRKSGRLDFKELMRYRDLITLFVKRDFISLYKQTILGPIWIILQPVLTTITFAIVFGNIARIETGAPSLIFYMIGVTAWTYFADCVLKTSETFISNQNLFGKVYFPRLVIPLSIVASSLIKFGFQFLLFLIMYLYYLIFVPDSGLVISWQLILVPLTILIMAIFGMGIGLMISSLTTKYRDLRFLIQFGIQLAMFATPIVYPLNKVSESYQWILQLNPMTPIIETLKVGFFGPDFGVFNWGYLVISIATSCLFLFLGLRLFNRIEKSFMDTI